MLRSCRATENACGRGLENMARILALLLLVLVQACGWPGENDTTSVRISVPALLDPAAAGFLPVAASDFTDRNITSLRIRVSGNDFEPILVNTSDTQSVLEVEVPAGTSRTFEALAYGNIEGGAPIDLWQGTTQVDVAGEVQDIAIKLQPDALPAFEYNVQVDAGSEGIATSVRLVLLYADGGIANPLPEFSVLAGSNVANRAQILGVTLADPQQVDYDLVGQAELWALSRDGLQAGKADLPGTGLELKIAMDQGVPAAFSFGGGIDLRATRDGKTLADNIDWQAEHVDGTILAGQGSDLAQIRWLEDGQWSLKVYSGDQTATASANVVAGSVVDVIVDFPPLVSPDTTAPETTIDSAPPAVTSSGYISVAFSASEENVSFQCQINSGSWSSCTSPLATARLADGGHVIRVRALDQAGNVDETPAEASFTVDSQAPGAIVVPLAGVASDLAVTAGETSDGTSLIGVVTADETLAVVDTALSDAGAVCSALVYPGTAPLNTNLATSQSYKVCVRVEDAAGNEAFGASAAFMYDGVVPTVASAVIAGGVAAVSTATVSVAVAGAADNLALDNLKIAEDAAFTTILYYGAYVPTTSVTMSAGDGSRTLWVRVYDLVGNISNAVSDTVTLDTVAPDISLDGAPPALTNDAGLSVSFSSTDGSAQFKCRLDAGIWEDCSSPYLNGGLSDTGHTFQVYAYDAVGFQSSVTNTSWTVDTLPPATILDSSPPDPATSSTATFTFSGDAATFYCDLDAGGATPCTSPHVEFGLVDGLHTFAVYGVDAAGNMESPGAMTSWTIDTQAPDISLDVVPAVLTNQTSASLEFSSTDGLAVFECQLNLGGYGPCSSPHLASGLVDGLQQFDVRAIDMAGLSSPVSSVTWEVDTIPPTGLALTLQSGAPAVSSVTISIDVSSADAVSQAADGDLDVPVVFSVGTTAANLLAGDGTKVVEVVFYDAAGNTDAVTAAIDLDTAAPDLAFDATPDPLTNNSLLDISFSSSDGSAMFECEIDGGGFSTCSSPWSFGTQPDGLHTLRVRAFDTVLNMAAPVSVQVDVDTAAPVSTLLMLDGGAGVTAANGITAYVSGPDSVWVDLSGDFNESPLAFAIAGAQVTAITLTASNATKYIQALFYDAAGNTAPVQEAIDLDASAPIGAIDLVAAGPVSETSQSVTFTVQGTYAPFAMRITGDILDSFSGQWIAFTAATTVTLAPTDGVRTVYTQYRNTLGVYSPIYVDNIVFDSTPPSADSILVESGAGAVSDVVVDIVMTATDAQTMELAEDVGFSQILYSGSFTAATAVTLSGGDGQRAVYMRVYDTAGNMSTAISDTVTLDTTPPGLASIIVDGDAPYLNYTSGIPVAITAADADYLTLAMDAGFATIVYDGPITTATTVNIPAGEGLRGIYGRVTDTVGWQSGIVSDTFTLDTTLPVLISAPFINEAVDGVVNLAESVSGLALIGTVAVNEPAVVTYSPQDHSADCTLQAYSGAVPLVSDLGGSGDTDYKVCLKLLDNAGNETVTETTTLTYDVTPSPVPTIALDGGDMYTNALTVQVALAGFGDAVTMQLSEDSGHTLNLYTGIVTTNTAVTLVPGDGERWVYVRTFDAVGNGSGNSSDSITVDTVAPTGLSLVLAAGATVTSSAAITAQVSAVDAVEFDLYGDIDAPFAGAVYPTNAVTAITLSAGDATKTVTAVFYDAAGNTAAVSDQIELSSGLPGGAITAAVDAVTVPTVEVHLTAFGPSSPYAMMLTGDITDGFAGSWIPYNAVSNVTLDGAQGNRTVYYRVRNALAVEAATVYSMSITFDSIAPDTTIDVYPPALTSVTSVTLQFSANEPGFFECQVDSGLYALCSSPASVTIAGEGAHGISVRATDLAGNVESVAAMTTVTLDTTAPLGSFSTSLAYQYEATFTVYPGGSDLHGPVQVRYGGTITDSFAGQWLALAGSYDVHVPNTEGVYSITAEYRDAASNVSGLYSLSVTLDQTNPVVAILNPAAGPVSTPPAVTGTVTDLHALAAVSIDILEQSSGFYYDGGSFIGGGQQFLSVSGTTSWAYGGLTGATLSDGDYHIYVDATDEAGNIGTDFVTIAYDGSAPTCVTCAELDTQLTRNTTMTMLSNVTDATGPVYARYSGAGLAFPTSGSWVAYDPAQSISVISVEGTYTINVEYKDGLGNISPMYGDTVTIDVTPPSPVAVTLANGAETVSVTSVVLELFAPDAVTFDVGGADITNPMSGLTMTDAVLVDLTPGEDSKFVDVKFYDAAGNVTQASDSVYLDTSAPWIEVRDTFMLRVTDYVLSRIADGVGALEGLGASFALAGDLNGDGQEDVFVGADNSSGPGTVYALSLSDGSILWTHDGSGGLSGDLFGHAIATYPDWNNDGVADVVATMPRWGSGNDNGAVYVLSGTDGTELAGPVTGGVANAWMGEAVVVSDDMNGDGYPDIAVSSKDYNANDGRVWFLSGADLSEIFVIDSPEANAFFGASLLADLDINQDGKRDLLIGAISSSLGDSGAGGVYAYSLTDGSPLWSIPGIGSFSNEFGGALAALKDGDEYRYLAVADSKMGTASGLGRVYVYDLTGPVLIHQLDSQVASENFGDSIVGMPGMDGDADPWVLVGAPNANSVFGRAYWGSAFGHPNELKFAEGSAVSDSFGSAIAGPVYGNGDGYADFLVGARGQDFGGNAAGAVYLAEAMGMPRDYSAATSPTFAQFFGKDVTFAAFSLDGSAWSGTTDVADAHEYHALGLTEGTHTVSFLVKDGAGNQSPVTSFTWGIDLTPPNIAVTSSVPLTTGTIGSLFMQGNASDPVSAGVGGNVRFLMWSAHRVTGGPAQWWDGNDYVNANPYEDILPVAGPWNFNLPISGPGTYTAYLQVIDGTLANTSVSEVVTIDVDGLPPLGSATPERDYSNKVTVDVFLSATDDYFGDPELEYRLGGDVTNGGSWQPMTNVAMAQLSAGDAVKSISVEFRDLVGNASSPYWVQVTLDTTAPLFSVTEPVYDAVTSAALLVGDLWDTGPAPSGVTTAWITLFDGSWYWDGVSFSAASPVTHPIAVTSPWMYAPLTDIANGWFSIGVDMFAMDKAGNLNNPWHQFVLDRNPPNCVTCVSIDPGIPTYPYANTYMVSLHSFNVSDETGPIQMRISGDIGDGFKDAWIGYNSYQPVNLVMVEGLKTVSVEYKDGAGNIAGPYFDSVTLDITPPAVTAVVINGGAPTTVSQDVWLAVTADASVYSYDITGDIVAPIWDVPVSDITNTVVTLTAGDFEHVVWVQGFDHASNGSLPVSDSIFLNGTPPNIWIDLAPGMPAVSTLGITAAINYDPNAYEYRITGDVSGGGSWVPVSGVTDVALLGGTGFSPVPTTDIHAWMGMEVDSEGRIYVGGLVIRGIYNNIFASRLLADGTVDTSWGTSGYAEYSFNSSNIDVGGVALSDYGEFVIVGDDSVDALIVKFDSAGYLDASFGNSGTMVIDFGGDDTFADATFDHNGKLVAVGSRWNGVSDQIIAAGFDNVGLDANFADAGTGVLYCGDQCRAEAVMEQYGIYYIGGKISSNNSDRFIVALDQYGDGVSHFGNYATASILSSPAYEEVAALAEGDEGTLYLASANGDTGGIEVIQFDEYGVPVSAFGAGGLASFDAAVSAGATAEIYAIDIDYKGRIYVAGQDQGIAYITRLLPDGQLDAGFAAGGTFATSWNGAQNAYATGVRSSISGGAVVSGYGNYGAAYTAVTTRLYDDGQINYAYGEGGAGWKQVYVTARDSGFQQGITYQTSIEVELIPPTGMVTSPVAVTDSETVELYISGFDTNGVTAAMFVGDVTGPHVFFPFDGSLQATAVTLIGNYGHRLVGLMLIDSAQNAGGPYYTDVAVDLAAPTGSIWGPEYTNNTTVNLSLDAWDDVDDRWSMQMRLDGGSWISFQDNYTHVIPGGDGVTNVTVQYMDNFGRVSPVYGIQVTLDTGMPAVTVLEPLASAVVTAPVMVTGTAYDAGSPVTEVFVAWEDGASNYWNGTTWAPGEVRFFAGSGSIWSASEWLTAPVVELTYNAHIWARDAAGNEGYAMRAITIDTTPPACGPCNEIQPPLGTYPWTNTANVILHSSNVNDPFGPIEMKVDGDIVDGFAGAWMAYNSNLPITLSPGETSKTVEVSFRDAAGNEAGIFFDTVTLDTQPPVIGSFLVAGGLPVTSQINSIPLQIQSAEGATWSVHGPNVSPRNGLPFSPPVTNDIFDIFCCSEGTVNVTAEVWDVAGNVGKAVTAIVIDTSPPVGTIFIEGDVAAVSEVTVQVDLSFVDSWSAVSDVRFTGVVDVPGIWLPYNTTFFVELPPGDGSKQIDVEVRDSVGNISGFISDMVDLDTTAPLQPLGLQAKVINGEAHIQWNPETGTANYELYYDSVSGVLNGTFANEGASPLVIADPITSATLTGLPAGQKLYVAVRAIDGIGNSSPMSAQAVTSTGVGLNVLVSELLFQRSLTNVANLNGAAASEGFGEVIAGLGDVNHDGVPDYAVGVSNYAAGDGQITVFSGATHVDLYTVNAEASQIQFGAAIVGLADTNQDGTDDIAVGAPGADFNGSESGRLYVLSGTDGTVLGTRDGGGPGDNFGKLLARVNDYSVIGLDGDGIDEIAVADQVGVFVVSANNLAVDRHVFANVRATAFAEFDVDGGRVYASSVSQDGGYAYMLDVSNGTQHTLASSVDTAEDFGSSIALHFGAQGKYLLVGAPGNDTGGADRGRVYVYDLSGPTNLGLVFVHQGLNDNGRFGSAIGWFGDGDDRLMIGADGTNANTGRVYYYSDVTMPETGMLDGQISGDRFGATLNWLGDVGVQGTPDIAIGAPGANSGNGVIEVHSFLYEEADFVQADSMRFIPQPGTHPVDVNLQGIEARYDGGSWGPFWHVLVQKGSVFHGVIPDPIPEGFHALEFRVIDSLGSSGLPVSHVVGFDHSLPAAASITSPVSFPTNQSWVAGTTTDPVSNGVGGVIRGISWSSQDTGSGFWWDGSSYSSAVTMEFFQPTTEAWSFELPLLGAVPATYEVSVLPLDGAFNQAPVATTTTIEYTP